MIAAYGAIAFVSASPDALLERLVHDEGWFPVTSMGAAGAANPYGVEGITTIAFELCEELGGLPDAVLVPASSGDQLYGVFKGFRELVELGLAERCPRMIGCQAAGAAPLAAAFREHLDEVPVLPNPTTVAASIGDATGSKPAVDAVRQSGGTFVTVADHEILRGQRSLAANGLLVEAASAATLAALTSRGCSDAFGQGERVVRLLTGSGAKWSAQLVSTTSGHIWLEPTPDELSAHLAADRSEARPPVDRRVPSC